ncbi:hypothetical protein [Streptomyces sp. NPDC058701]|uniref:hypothetical protein n=1 Tax=Streptomyces sp. NPDC058701 TaxID=3346608 RepID=UPI0036484070
MTGSSHLRLAQALAVCPIGAARNVLGNELPDVSSEMLRLGARERHEPNWFEERPPTRRLVEAETAAVSTLWDNRAADPVLSMTAEQFTKRTRPRSACS